MGETTAAAERHWEWLVDDASFKVRRAGRFLVADLQGPHLVLSTSTRHGGQATHVRHLLNHQSCEGAAHLDRHRVMTEHGLDAYHDVVCQESGMPAGHTAVMGTAANMAYAALVKREDGALAVLAIVTAGVQGNATAPGEPATWRETDGRFEQVPAYAGTINTMLLVNGPLTEGALARVVVTMTEGKSAALQRLAVPSTRHLDLATGTGTDQYCVAAPRASAHAPRLTSASPHMKLGELVGGATCAATMEALRWQNGLEASYTRGLFHALSRYGVKEATIFEELAPMLAESDRELLAKNAKAAFHEPLVGAAAHALATTCDRVRHGMVPEAVAADALVQQAAALAANLAAQVHRWAEFRQALLPFAKGEVKTLVLRAIALGWSEKWRSS